MIAVKPALVIFSGIIAVLIIETVGSGISMDIDAIISVGILGTCLYGLFYLSEAIPTGRSFGSR